MLHICCWISKFHMAVHPLPIFTKNLKFDKIEVSRCKPVNKYFPSNNKVRVPDYLEGIIVKNDFGK